MSELPYCNGLNATTGDYLGMPASLDAVAREVLAGPGGDELIRLGRSKASDLEPIDQVDVRDLASAGWGVLFAPETDPAVREALAPLLEHRRGQAQALYREIEGENGYRPGRSAENFLASWGAELGSAVDPAQLPYYLLLVGSPAQIPYEFQYELDASYGVGRLCFDTPEEYARYAESVVAHEKRHAPPRRRAVIFGVRNEDDPATDLSLRHLADPVAEALPRGRADWILERVSGGEATKERLARLLGDEAPALLFTAGHGLALYPQDPRQRAEQGALICGDWPGREKWKGNLPPDFYFSAADVDSAADLSGMITFLFACFSAATPGQDDFDTLTPEPYPAADHPFVARLPQRLLAQPGGRGALAVIGHVDRVWVHSFLHTGESRAESNVFEQSLGRILDGYPVGYALEFFNRRSANRSLQLSNLLFQQRRGEPVDADEVAHRWLVNNDARNYVLFGDPAVRVAD